MLVAILCLSILLVAEVAFLICFQIRKGLSDARQSPFPVLLLVRLLRRHLVTRSAPRLNPAVVRVFAIGQ